jgi:hypothetical protein
MRSMYLAACVTLLALPAAAQTSPPTHVQTVADLAAVCAPADGMAPIIRLEAIAYCQGYITAAAQYHAALSRPAAGRQPLFCPPSPPPTVAQAALGFAAWAGQNPARAQEPALDGLPRFAQATYPCPAPAPRRNNAPSNPAR